MIITLSSQSIKKDISQNSFKFKVLHDRQHVVNFSFFIFLEKKGKIIKHHKLPFFHVGSKQNKFENNLGIITRQTTMDW